MEHERTIIRGLRVGILLSGGLHVVVEYSISAQLPLLST